MIEVKTVIGEKIATYDSDKSPLAVAQTIINGTRTGASPLLIPNAWVFFYKEDNCRVYLRCS